MNRKSVINRLGGIMAGGLMLFMASAANAVPILSFDGSGDVDGVTGLVVDGMTYDATWAIGSFDTSGQNPTVLTNITDATSLVNMINTLFNDNSITPLDVAGVCTDSNSNDCDLIVAYNINVSSFDAVNVEWRQPSGPWEPQNQNWSRTDDFGIRVAQVTLTKVPEPGTLALLGLGLAGLGFARRKKE